MMTTNIPRPDETPIVGAGWRRSSFSQGSDQTCVDVAFAGTAVMVRDSKNPAGPTLCFTAHEWDVFLRGVEAGEFDLPGSSQLPES